MTDHTTYEFETEEGTKTLAELFDGRSQLLVKLKTHKRRMGWRFPSVSSLGSDFNFDFGVSYTEDQQAHGAEYNFRWEDDPEGRPWRSA